MTVRGWARPPGGEAVLLGELKEIIQMQQPRKRLRERLAAWLDSAPDADSILLRRSGRAALRTVFERWKEASGRDEVLVPAYTCYSVPAAVVAAGLRVRLVDVDLEGRIDVDALEQIRLQGGLERVSGVVVCNLFGWAEAIAPIESITAQAGIEVLDDAAQSLWAMDTEGQRVGDRGRAAVLSFGRGKPLQGLGGGAVIGFSASSEQAEQFEEAMGAGGALKAAVRSAVWDASLTRPVFSILSRIPALGIGQTPFEPGFEHGPIDAANAAIAAVQLPALETRAAARRARARRLSEAIAEKTYFIPLVDPRPEEGVYSRLALRAPHLEARSRALSLLETLGAGASRLYPDSLADVAALAPHRTDAGEERDFPQSRALAARILTLPTNRDLSEAEVQAIVKCLTEASCA